MNIMNDVFMNPFQYEDDGAIKEFLGIERISMLFWLLHSLPSIDEYFDSPLYGEEFDINDDNIFTG
jgi:hypothetical protein